MQQLMMYRPDGLPLPNIAPADGYSLRTMREGEEADWCRCCLGHFGVDSEDTIHFSENMAGICRDRIYFACDGSDRPVGTVSAVTKQGRPYMHRLAVDTAHRGHRLGSALLCAVILRHASDGLEGCFLNTDDFRIPAVKTYLSLGFRPVLASDDAPQRWRKLANELGCKELEAYVLSGNSPISFGRISRM